MCPIPAPADLLVVPWSIPFERAQTHTTVVACKAPSNDVADRSRHGATLTKPANVLPELPVRVGPQRARVATKHEIIAQWCVNVPMRTPCHIQRALCVRERRNPGPIGLARAGLLFAHAPRPWLVTISIFVMTPDMNQYPTFVITSFGLQGGTLHTSILKRVQFALADVACTTRVQRSACCVLRVARVFSLASSPSAWTA